MMKLRFRNALAVVAIGAALAGCAGSAPKQAALTSEQVQNFSVQQADIDVSGVAAGSKGRKVSAASIKAALERRSD